MKLQVAEAGESQHPAASRSAVAANLDSFVINLCSSTTPMALAHPDTPELKRFKFFVSRRLEDGRERFRLHMGHFESLEEAEDWLGVVRDVYPGAWAGEAPGKRLRAREAAKAPPAAPELPSAPSEASGSHIKLPSPAPLAAAVPAAHSASAPPALPAPKIASPTPAVPVPAAAPKPAIAAPAARAASAPPKGAAAAPGEPRATAAAPTVHRTDTVATKLPAAQPAPAAPLSNVREVMAALDERDARSSNAAPTRTPASSSPASQSLTDTQVMQILEARRTATSPPAVAREMPSGIALLRPDDTGTRHAIKEAVRDNAAVSFAVQLQWAGQPLALDKVPPLAIFSAYTLYTVEGTRGGRTWYGLRLGFFSDSSTARQVAGYVRSDFASVAVVPVSQGERERAVRKDRTTAAASFPHAMPVAVAEEIPLFDAAGADPPRVSLNHRGGSVNTGSAAARAAAARSKKLRAEASVAEVVKAEHTLEETLEILGAGALEIDNGRGEFINQSGMHRQLEVRKNSPFQRLLARLTERVRKG